MHYPKELQDYIQSNQKHLAIMSKSLKDRNKFKNMISNNKIIFDQYDALEFDDNISIENRIRMIKFDLKESPKCLHCNTQIEHTDGYGNYPKCCNKSCQAKYQSSIGENGSSVSITVDGIEYKKFDHVYKKYDISYHILNQRLFSCDYPEWKYTIDHDKTILDYFNKINSKLTDNVFLVSKRDAGVPISVIADELNIKKDSVQLAYKYFGISTKYNQIPEESSALLHDKEWIQARFDEGKTFVEIADILNCSDSAVRNTAVSMGMTLPIIQGSLAEEEMANYIISIREDCIRHDRKQITPFELDVYIPELNLAFEYNGVYWHREKKLYHYEKYKMCADKGIRLIQIFEDDWNTNKELVKKKIANSLHINDDKIGARKCSIRNIESYEAKSFYDKNHIYGHKNCSNHFGLFHESELVACMSFIKNGLERYATSKSVQGGFSKLFNYALTELNLDEVTTFADLCWSDELNNVYINNGFKLVKITSPNYWWVVKGKRESRLKYQKHKLQEFDNYEEGKSETQIMHERGYYRVYDAGHAKLTYKK